jgi:hypothetical protein
MLSVYIYRVYKCACCGAMLFYPPMAFYGLLQTGYHNLFFLLSLIH